MKRVISLLALVFSVSLIGCKKQAKTNKVPKVRKSTSKPVKARPRAVVLKPTPSPAGAKVFIVSPKDGATVKSPFEVKFGISGMTVAPAGVKKPNTGHHHLLIDMDKLPDLTKPLPKSKQLIHFGKGQTSTKLTLKPGKHTLQLLLADYRHLPHKPAVFSKKITITVK
ncbi:MAG: DUF4399 domain-containing protein [Gammaproteobacteria bacterium]|nr:MAG: DUF4399 domain-containing protein [Gammaproteobacteria bacterium]